MDHPEKTGNIDYTRRRRKTQYELDSNMRKQKQIM